MEFPAEQAAIAARRHQYGIPGDAPECGLTFSGGGIRSATFSLGLLRGFSTLKLLQRIDYLSTVSGGGYAGSFYCGLFAGRGGEAPVVEARPDDDLLAQDRAQKALGYLRQSGRYLTPGGGRDYAYAIAILLRNWVALSLVIGMAMVLVEMLLDLARWCLVHHASVPAGWIWLSPLLLLIVPLLLCLTGVAWAYWLTVSNVSRPWFRPPLWGTLLVVLGSAAMAFGWPPHKPETGTDWAGVALLAISVKALGDWIVAFRWSLAESGNGADHNRAIVEDRTRHRLSIWQSYLAQWTFWLTITALADSATFLLTEWHFIWVQVSPVVIAAVPAARWLTKQLASVGKDAAGGLMARLGGIVAWAGAILFVLAALAFWGGIAHALVWVAHPDKPMIPILKHATLWWAMGAAVVFVTLASISQGFVNLSTLATFYAGRLRRAYLGAGNPDRIGATPGVAITAVTDSHPKDDLGLVDYYERSRSGAPVHLINVTINETLGKGPQTVQRDRQGLNMVVSPDGMSYSEVTQDGVTIKPLGHEGGHRAEKPGQSLPLSTWIGISGAAFTTGLGSATSLSRSILAFLGNVRLGYWWQADRTSRDFSWSYASLFREMFAMFPGTCKPKCYLSDGGHFENSGAYELVRRKVPFIIYSDNGWDPQYGMEDVANLVRKSRIDFGAEISFLNEEELDALLRDRELRQLFAGPWQFAKRDEMPHAIAMLARLDYADGTTGTLLVVKPRLSPNGPADLQRYITDNPDFPMQSTLDQFFDEAQWESYYELGRRMAMRLFERRGCGWEPYRMESLAWDDGWVTEQERDA